MAGNNYSTGLKSRLRQVNYAIALIGGVVVFLTIFSTTIDVIGRFFNKPLTFVSETSELALAILVFLGWAYTQCEKSHIAIDLVYNFFPRNLKRLLNMINPIFGIALMGLMGYQGLIFTLQSRSSNEVTDSLHMPVWPFKSLIVLGAILLLAQLLVDMIDQWRNARSDGEAK